MEDKTMEYDKRLAAYRDRVLQRNREMTTDDDDDIDAIIKKSTASIFGQTDNEATTDTTDSISEKDTGKDSNDSIFEKTTDAELKGSIFEKTTNADSNNSIFEKTTDKASKQTEETKTADLYKEQEEQIKSVLEEIGMNDASPKKGDTIDMPVIRRTSKNKAEQPENTKKTKISDKNVVRDTYEDDGDYLEEESMTLNAITKIAGGILNIGGKKDKTPEQNNSAAQNKTPGQNNSATQNKTPEQNNSATQNRKPNKNSDSGKTPSRKGPRPLNSLQKWALLAAVLLVVFVIVTIAYVSANARYKYNQMDIREIAESDLMVNDGVATVTKSYTTIALYGVDSRDSNLNAGTNSDSIIIVSINNETKETKLVSIYRDTMVKIQNSTGVTNKVNYAYQLGGALMAINTLNANFDLNITNYITVDFNAMANIINALGGVEVDIKEEEINNLNKNLAEQIGLSGVYSDGVHEAGVQMLNGQQAVAYSRIRSTANGDITRTERQRTVLMGLISRAMTADSTVLSNLIDVSFEGISTSFTKNDINNLVKDLSEYNITGNTGFPFSYSFVSLADKGNIIVASDIAANVSALHEYLYGESNYTPSSTVETISSEIASETGVASTTVIVPSDDIGGNSEDNAGSSDDENGIEDNSESDDSTNNDTITAPPEGMIENE